MPSLKSMSTDELRAYNAAAQRRHREKTNNTYGRAQRRAMQRAVRWVQQEHPGVYELMLAEELAKDNDKPLCTHASQHAIGISMACDECKTLTGVDPL